MGYTGEQKVEYQRRWMQARRIKAIEYLGSSCAGCGSSDKLEFDHKVRELKTSNISWLLSRKWEVLKDELDKCQLLCSDCHREKTRLEIPEWKGEAVHGSGGMYAHHGCRCQVCKDGHAEYMRKYRQLNTPD
mgnify:FL=1